jgi:hypothetical protein
VSARRCLLSLLGALAACGDESAPPAAPATFGPAAPGELRFAARREQALGARPDGLLAADLDGDGHAELVAALRVPGELWVWWGSARGLERTPKKLACGDWPLRPVALPAGSFGAGPRQRFVAVASRAAQTLQVFDLAAQARPFELDLAGSLGAPRALAAGRLEPHAGAVIALVGDADRLILSERDLGAVKPEPHGGLLPRCAMLLEDGGGLAIGFQGSSAVELWRPGAAPRWLALPGFPREILELDWNGDGAPELVVAGGDRALSIFDLEDEGGAAQEVAVDAIPIAARAADLDGDGRDELALVHHYDLTALVLRAGAERLGRAYAGQTPVDVAVLDADGDGELDLVVANSNTLGLSFLPGARGQFATDARVAVGDTPTSIAAADTDGDGAIELAVVSSKDEELCVVDPRTRGVLARVATGSQPRAVAAADLDGDGRDELALLMGREHGTELALFWRGPDGGCARREARPDLAVSQGGADLLLVDLDGDGRAEALVADPEARVVVLVREPAGTPRAVPFPTPAAALALAPIELDGDAAPEIAVAFGAPRAGVSLLDARADPERGLVLHEVSFVPLAGAPLDLAAGDLDGDGRADLVVLARIAADSIEGSILPLVRDGDGFRALDGLPTGLNAHHVACADADGDGRADVFVTAQNSHLVNAWRAAGTGGALVLERLDDIGAGTGCLDLALADLDGDGRLDLAVANAFSDDVSLIFGRN